MQQLQRAEWNQILTISFDPPQKQYTDASSITTVCTAVMEVWTTKHAREGLSFVLGIEVAF